MSLFELWFSQGICPVVGLLGHSLRDFKIFLRRQLGERLHWQKIQSKNKQTNKSWSVFPGEQVLFREKMGKKAGEGKME